AESRDLKIIVQQVFYKKWWFIILCSLAITALVFGIERYRSQQKLKVEKLRTKISSDLHDEVSGLLSGIAMQTDILQMTTADEKSKKRLQKMGVVSRSAMSRMSDVIWSIDSRKDHFEDLLHRMHGHAEELLTPLQIPYNFQLENLNRQKKLPVELRQNLYFIFKECINNIAKHSNAERVNIIIKNTDKQFIMAIHDDGTTNQLDKEKPKPGQGLSNLKMRAERINAELEIDNTNGFLVELRRKQI
ncbi:MAG: sensor histidine kinase, partial [Saprospiraceae bacterium]